MMPHTYPHVTVTPRLGHNDTPDLPAQLTFNVTPPHLVHSSSRRELYQERVTPLFNSIACIVDYGNLQLQQRARKFVFKARCILTSNNM